VTDSQLDLIHLTVTPREARMLATAAYFRALSFEGGYQKRGWPATELEAQYKELGAKVDRQRQL